MPPTERRALSVVFTSMLLAGIIQNDWFCALGAVICTRSPQCFLYADDGWEVSCGASFNAYWDLVSSGESDQFCCLFKVLLTAVLLGSEPFLCRAADSRSIVS